MTATNHVLTGALIGSLVTNPLIALPLALASHLALDMIPHYGNKVMKINTFVPYLLVDMTLAALLLLSILANQPHNYWLMIACGILASSPDLLSIPYFVDLLKHRDHKFGKLTQFLKKIQWSETPMGLIIEAVWFLTLGAILLGRIS